MSSIDQEIIKKLKISCRIDEDSDELINEEINDLKLSAETYLKNAGIDINYTNQLYTLAIKILVKHWFDSDGILDSRANEVPFGLNSIINQLQLCGVGDSIETK